MHNHDELKLNLRNNREEYVLEISSTGYGLESVPKKKGDQQDLYDGKSRITKK